MMRLEIISMAFAALLFNSPEGCNKAGESALPKNNSEIAATNVVKTENDAAKPENVVDQNQQTNKQTDKNKKTDKSKPLDKSLTAKLFKGEDGVQRITIEDAKAAFDSGKAVIIDVRGTESYKNKHIKGSLDFADVLNNYDKLPKDKLIIAYCS